MAGSDGGSRLSQSRRGLVGALLTPRNGRLLAGPGAGGGCGCAAHTPAPQAPRPAARAADGSSPEEPPHEEAAAAGQVRGVQGERHPRKRFGEGPDTQSGIEIEFTNRALSFVSVSGSLLAKSTFHCAKNNMALGTEEALPAHADAPRCFRNDFLPSLVFGRCSAAAVELRAPRLTRTTAIFPPGIRHFNSLGLHFGELGPLASTGRPQPAPGRHLRERPPNARSWRARREVGRLGAFVRR